MRYRAIWYRQDSHRCHHHLSTLSLYISYKGANWQDYEIGRLVNCQYFPHAHGFVICSLLVANYHTLDALCVLVSSPGFSMFGGVEPITEYFALPEFYHFTPHKFSWPDIPESFDIDYLFEVAT